MSRKDLIIDETEVENRDIGTADVALDEETGMEVQDDVINEDGDAGSDLPREATVNPDGTVTLKLKYPQKMRIRGANGKEREDIYDELVFHRLTGADINAIGAASATAANWVGFARSTRIRDAIMRHLYDKMDGYDIANGGSVIQYFLPSGRKTGQKS